MLYRGPIARSSGIVCAFHKQHFTRPWRVAQRKMQPADRHSYLFSDPFSESGCCGNVPAGLNLTDVRSACRMVGVDTFLAGLETVSAMGSKAPKQHSQGSREERTRATERAQFGSFLRSNRLERKDATRYGRGKSDWNARCSAGH